MRRRKFHIVKNCCNYINSVWHFFILGVWPSLTVGAVRGSCMPKQSFGTVRSGMQACMLPKLLPIFIGKRAAEHRAHGVSMKQCLFLSIFLNRASLVSINNQIQKERWESMNVLWYWKDNDEFCILIQSLYTFRVAQRGHRVLEISPWRLLLL